MLGPLAKERGGRVLSSRTAGRVGVGGGSKEGQFGREAELESTGGCLREGAPLCADTC